MNSENRPELVILISIDGCRWDYPDRAATPNIDSIKERGSYVVKALTTFPSLTQTGHSSIITGTYPSNHGVVGHVYYDRAQGREVKWSPQDLNATTLLEYLSNYGFKTASVLFPMSRGGDLVVSKDEIPEFVAKELGPIPSDPVERDDWALKAAILVLERENPDVLLLHFKSVDKIGHKYGPDSDEVISALEHIDSLIGQLLNWLNDHGLLTQTLFVITADHGMTEVEEAVPIRALLSKQGFKSYVTYEGRISKIYLSPEDDPQELIEFLRGVDGVSLVITKEEFQDFNLPAWSEKAGDIVVVASEGRIFSGTLDKLGQHGALTEWDLRVPIILSGPGIPVGKAVREASVVDIFPTICEILGVPVPDTVDGHPITQFEDPLPIEAEDKVRLAELTISSLSGRCDLSAAEEALQAARQELESLNYQETVKLADKAIQLAKMSLKANLSIAAARSAIEQARSENRTEGLEKAESRLAEAISAYQSHDYTRAESVAKEAEEIAKGAVRPSGISAETILVGAVIVLVIVGLPILWRARGAKKSE